MSDTQTANQSEQMAATFGQSPLDEPPDGVSLFQWRRVLAEGERTGDSLVDLMDHMGLWPLDNLAARRNTLLTRLATAATHPES